MITSLVPQPTWKWLLPSQMGTPSDDITCMEGLAKGLPDIAMSAISCSVSLSVFWLQTQSYKAIKITKESKPPKPPVLRVDHSSSRSAPHPWYSLCGLVCHVGGSSDAGKPKLCWLKILETISLPTWEASFLPWPSFAFGGRERAVRSRESLRGRERRHL